MLLCGNTTFQQKSKEVDMISSEMIKASYQEATYQRKAGTSSSKLLLADWQQNPS